MADIRDAERAGSYPMTQSQDKLAEKLLPCPFCGEVERISDSHIRDGRSVGCRNCGASVLAWQPDATKKAIAKWNTRHTAPSAPGEDEANGVADRLEKLRLMLDEVEDVLDKQTYDEKRKAQFDLPDDYEYSVTISANHERAIGKVLTGLQNEIAALRTRALSTRLPDGMAVVPEADRDELERLRKLINTPELHDFWEAVKREAVHQRERWGDDHDKAKSPNDWVALVTYLMGKAVVAAWDGDIGKYLHHIITLGAVSSNWHARTMEALAAAPRPHTQTEAE